jgi:queuine/archaeosine tRNA-ribosyltransferase
MKFGLLRLRSVRIPMAEPKHFGYLMPISLQNGCATALDKIQLVQLILGTVTKITKEIIIEVENNTTLDLLFMIDKVIETEEKEKERRRRRRRSKGRENHIHKRSGLFYQFPPVPVNTYVEF